MKRRDPSLLSGRRVLLIDDDPSSVRAIADALGARVEVVDVSSAHLALKMLASGERFDAIVYELETPDATGREFYERACRGDASLGRRIVLMARAKATVHWAAVAPLGCPSVAKPIDESAVRAALEHVVRSDERLASELSATAFGLDADVLNVTAVPSDVDDAGGGTPFGPFYPAPLQGAVTHAERLARAISDALDTILESPAFDPNEPTDAELWLVGRAEEVEAFVAEIVKDWRRGAVRLSDAAAVLERYIESMHRGMRAYLTHAGLLPCCGAVDLATTSVVDHTAEAHPRAPVITDTPTPSN